jgi:hypothetical protein
MGLGQVRRDNDLTGRFPLMVEAAGTPYVRAFVNSSRLEGERVVANQISYQSISPKGQHEFNGWLRANAILGSIFTISMLAMAVAGANSAGRSDAAMAATPNVANVSSGSR